jgi:predicted dehydrogenase
VINAGIAGLGWWGKTLVEGVADSSDIKFVAGSARNHTDDIKAFAKQNAFTLYQSFEEMLKHPGLDAVVLATPHSLHVPQTIAAAQAGKHVFCEKPFALSGAEAREAADAVEKAGVTLGLGYNRRWHPEMTKLRHMIDTGELGIILHVEATMTFPNALLLKADAWRASREETPCGGLTPMGVHAVDGMIDLCGPIDEVYCQSFRRAVSIERIETSVLEVDHGQRDTRLVLRGRSAGHPEHVGAPGPGAPHGGDGRLNILVARKAPDLLLDTPRDRIAERDTSPGRRLGVHKDLDRRNVFREKFDSIVEGEKKTGRAGEDEDTDRENGSSVIE